MLLYTCMNWMYGSMPMHEHFSTSSCTLAESWDWHVSSSMLMNSYRIVLINTMPMYYAYGYMLMDTYEYEWLACD